MGIGRRDRDGTIMSAKLLRTARIAIVALAALAFGAIGSLSDAAAQQDSQRDAQRDTQRDAQRDSWPELADSLFRGRQLADGTGLIAIEMPARAEDAALV